MFFFLLLLGEIGGEIMCVSGGWVRGGLRKAFLSREEAEAVPKVFS